MVPNDFWGNGIARGDLWEWRKVSLFPQIILNRMSVWCRTMGLQTSKEVKGAKI
jgi:hypothetical protein